MSKKRFKKVKEGMIVIMKKPWWDFWTPFYLFTVKRDNRDKALWLQDSYGAWFIKLDDEKIDLEVFEIK